MNHRQEPGEAFRALIGLSVVGWIGIEMAVRDEGEDGCPQWYDPGIPALQVGRLDILVAEGTVVNIVTVMIGTCWGLARTDGLPPLYPAPAVGKSIYRDRMLSELPVGVIQAAEVAVEEDDTIHSVYLSVAGHTIHLRAAEVQEELDHTLRIVDCDESVLIQVDGKRPR
jgi:hypothetical protein